MNKRKLEWSRFTNLSSPPDDNDDVEAETPAKRPRTNNSTQNPTGPDINVPGEEPSEDLHDEEPPEAESSEGENTISDPGDPDPNATTEEEPVGNVPDPSQAESSEGEGTISGPGDPDTDATIEEDPIENAPAPSSSQAGSVAQNTGSGQGSIPCTRPNCKRQPAPNSL
jgi:hypothetical protein